MGLYTQVDETKGGTFCWFFGDTVQTDESLRHSSHENGIFSQDKYERLSEEALSRGILLHLKDIDLSSHMLVLVRKYNPSFLYVSESDDYAFLDVDLNVLYCI